MTRQEIFDTVVRHLKSQGKRAVRPGAEDEVGGCYYRSPEGLKCAIGCLIPDDAYSSAMEGKSVDGICSMVADKRHPMWELLITNLNFLNLLQIAHDAPYNWNSKGLSPEGFKALDKIAVRHGLDTAVLYEVKRG